MKFHLLVSAVVPPEERVIVEIEFFGFYFAPGTDKDDISGQIPQEMGTTAVARHAGSHINV